MTIQIARRVLRNSNPLIARRVRPIAALIAMALISSPAGLRAEPRSQPIHSQQSAPKNPSQVVFALVPAQSKLNFTLGATAHDVHGEFDLKRGEIRIDPATGLVTGEIVAAAASGRTGSDGRDSKMQKDVLESAKYPELVFRPDRIDGFSLANGAFHASVHGVFSVHGSNHEITIPVDATVSANSWSASAKFKVPYVDWGLRDPSNFFLHVGKSVDIELILAGTIANSAAAR
jgi:polyisoprenoid-binding protein YceI